MHLGAYLYKHLPKSFQKIIWSGHLIILKILKSKDFQSNYQKPLDNQHEQFLFESSFNEPKAISKTGSVNHMVRLEKFPVSTWLWFY